MLFRNSGVNLRGIHQDNAILSNNGVYTVQDVCNSVDPTFFVYYSNLFIQIVVKGIVGKVLEIMDLGASSLNNDQRL